MKKIIAINIRLKKEASLENKGDNKNYNKFSVKV